MSHAAVYPGDFNALLKAWDEKARQAWKQHGQAGLSALKIANGECARLPQELTEVGHTSRWQPGERVIDVARTLRPGTVIANFVLKNGKMVYPNAHGFHAALFVKGERYSGSTGKPGHIIMFDQWNSPRAPKWPGPRTVKVWPEALAKGKSPCDKAEDFFVVLVR
jgi:hypothetical protein